MRRHVKTYCQHFGIWYDDTWRCEACGRWFKVASGLDIHHIVYRSQGGTDELSNLAALCRECHDKVHSGTMKFKLENSILQR